jgi:hypothetical protein
MSSHRFEVEVVDTERLVDASLASLVTLRLYDGPGVVGPHDEPVELADVFTDLRPDEARRLACDLWSGALEAECQSLKERQ